MLSVLTQGTLDIPPDLGDRVMRSVLIQGTINITPDLEKRVMLSVVIRPRDNGHFIGFKK